MSKNDFVSRLLYALTAVLFALSIAPSAVAQTAAIIAAPSVTVAPSQPVAVPISYIHGAGNVISIELRITWDPAVATLQTVAKGTLLGADWDLLANLITPGVAHIGLISSGVGLAAGGQLLVLNFQAAAQKGVTPITFASASLNEGLVSSTATNGSLRVNTPPVAVDDTYATSEDVKLDVDAPGVKAGDSDADSETLSVALDVPAAHGTVVLAGDGSFTYTPAANYFGPDSFTYTLSDPWGGSDTGAVAITVNSVNDVPVADAHGPYSAPEGGSVSLSGTAIDIDHTSGFIFEWDLDGSGTYATTGASPTFSAAGLDGPTSKTVMLRVRDPLGGLSVSVSAVVNVTNAAPTANSGGPYNVAAGGSVQLSGSASSDPAGANDPLTYAWDLDNNGSYETSGVAPIFDATALADAVVTIRLRVTDDGGLSNVAETTVTIGALPRYGLSGAILYWKGARPVVGASLTLQGAASGSTSSAAGGAWSFANLLGGNYTLTPAYAADSEAITAYDAALVLQHVAGNMVLAGNAAIAANANREGGISALDASLILQHAVGLIPVPFVSGGVVWSFDPANHTYSPLGATQPGQNFTAILLGDPSGNWDGLTVASTAAGQKAHVYLVAGQPEPDGTRTVNVVVDASAQQTASSVQLQLAYDSTLFEVLDAQPANGWLMAANRGSAGHVRVALANAQPITESESVLTLRLSARATDDDPAVVVMSAMVDEVVQAGGMNNQRIHLPLIQTVP